MANERGTTSLWIAKEKYKSFALACKRFNFQISEILEAFMDEFMVRYPLEDPNEIEYIQPPTFVPRKKFTPHVKEDLKQGLMKWLPIFLCGQCGARRYIKPEGLKFLEERGRPACCLKCGSNMEIEEAPPQCQ